MSTLFSELREAALQLRRAPGFSLLAIALLAVGLGATTAIFSLAYAIVLRPLPFLEPSRLIGFQAINPAKGIIQDGHSVADFRDYAQRSRSLAGLMAYRPNFAAYTRDGDQPVRLVSALVTDGFFSVLGVSPRVGRGFRPDEFSVAAPRAVVLSHAAWQRYFAAEPDALGRVIVLDDEPHTIVGIMAPEFREPEFVDIWLPFPREAPEYFARDSRFWTMVGRLGPGVTIESAQAEVRTIAADLAREFAETNRDWSTRLAPLQALRTQGMRHALLLLSGAVGLVLVIACLNLANLLLARGVTRLPDLAVRLALGATPAALARRVLFESALIAMFGGLAGCGLAALILRLMVQRLPAGLIPRWHEVALHPPVIGFALLAALATGVFFGLLPALQVRRVDANTLLKQGGARSATDSLGGRIQHVLVAGQISLSFVVLVASLLLMKSLVRLQDVHPGFEAKNVLTLQLAPPPQRYETNLELARYYERLIDEVATVPGVADVSINASAPLCGITLQYPFSVYGRSPVEAGKDEAVYAPVSENFFRTLELPLKQGRTFDRRDREESAPVAIVNETLARRLFPGENPLGQRIQILPWLSPDYREIVGVVGDTRQNNLTSPPPAQIYVPQRQMPWFFSTLLVRLDRPEAVRAVQAALRRADPTLPFAPVMLERNVAMTTVAPRLYAALFAIFAVVALALSAFGLYASVRFTTRRRTREIGIRVALGSSPARIVALVLSDAARLVAYGLAVGAVAALGLSTLLRTLLYGVQPADPWVYAAVFAVLPLVALAAAATTAVRAATLPPIHALQHE